MITILCDGGCGTAIPAHPRDARHDDGCRGCRQGHDGHLRGQLDPVVYCDHCVEMWTTYDAEERTERVKAVTAFEAWRRTARAALRTAMTRLPDDWDGGAEEN